MDPLLSFGRFTAEPDEPPPDADDLMAYAEDDIHLARFARRDDLAVQRKVRVEAIDAAIAHLEIAKLMLSDGVELASQEVCAALAIRDRRAS